MGSSVVVPVLSEAVDEDETDERLVVELTLELAWLSILVGVAELELCEDDTCAPDETPWPISDAEDVGLVLSPAPAGLELSTPSVWVVCEPG